MKHTQLNIKGPTVVSGPGPQLRSTDRIRDEHGPEATTWNTGRSKLVGDQSSEIEFEIYKRAKFVHGNCSLLKNSVNRNHSYKLTGSTFTKYQYFQDTVLSIINKILFCL